jgi:hypothetical protein
MKVGMDQLCIFPARTANPARIVILFVGTVDVLGKSKCECQFPIPWRADKKLRMGYAVFGERLQQPLFDCMLSDYVLKLHPV